MRVVPAVLAGLALAVALAMIVWRHAGTTSETRSAEPIPAGPRAETSAEAPLPVPVTEAERERAEYEQARAPFMHSLRASVARLDCEVTMGDDLSELSLTAPVWPREVVDAVRDEAIRLGAERKGFAVMRFYERSPAGSGLPPRLVAEVAHRDGRWTTFIR